MKERTSGKTDREEGVLLSARTVIEWGSVGSLSFNGTRGKGREKERGTSGGSEKESVRDGGEKESGTEVAREEEKKEHEGQKGWKGKEEGDLLGFGCHAPSLNTLSDSSSTALSSRYTALSPVCC